MEHKVCSAYIVKTDEAQGIVETIFAVFGNLDKGDDIIHPGAFTKTFAERGGKVKILDKHQRDSVLRVLGKPLAFRELARDELPTDLLKEYPGVTGGAWAQVQFNMKTQNGHDVFHLFKAGDVDEWSFGYDAKDYDFSEVGKVTARNLRTIKLYELSPVVFGMNPATTTTSAKEEKPEPEETENTVRVRVRDPKGFQSDSFRTIDIDKDRGIQAVIGRLKGKTTTTTQAYIFSKAKGWTIAKAVAWVKEHSKAVISIAEVVYDVAVAHIELNAINTERIDSTIEDIVIMLEKVGIDIVGTSKAGSDDDDTTHPDDKRAGSDDAPSTDDDLLRVIEIKQHQITLLEV